jgi:hypothetical protein
MGLKASRGGHTVTEIGTALLHTSYVEHHIVFNTLDDFKVFILSYVRAHQFCSVPTYGYVNKQRYRNKEAEKLNPPAWLYDDYLYQEYYCTYCTIHVLIPFNATFDLTHIKEYTVL